MYVNIFQKTWIQSHFISNCINFTLTNSTEKFFDEANKLKYGLSLF